MLRQCSGLKSNDVRVCVYDVRVPCHWLIDELTRSETTRGRLLGTPAKLTLADDLRSEPHEISLSVAIRSFGEMGFSVFSYSILDDAQTMHGSLFAASGNACVHSHFQGPTRSLS